MHDDIKFFVMEKRAHRVPITQIDLMDVNFVRNRGDVLALDPWIVKVVKVVENRYDVTKREQFLDKMRTDKTSAACD
jgi:hypothetical protein